jgi:hypothetical protein
MGESVIMNRIELQKKIVSAAYLLLRDKGYISQVELLLSLGVLSQKELKKAPDFLKLAQNPAVLNSYIC